MKIIDLTMLLEEDLPSDPEIQIPHIQRRNHKDTAEEMPKYFPGATMEDLPNGNGWAIDFVQMCTHSGTHLDAPWHYYPTQNEDVIPGGEKAWTIDEVPLEWCIGPGVKLDFRDKPDGYKITAQDVKDYLNKIGYTLKPGDIVLLNTGADKRWGTKGVSGRGCGHEQRSHPSGWWSRAFMWSARTVGAGMCRCPTRDRNSRNPMTTPSSGKPIAPVGTELTAISRS